MPSSMLPTMPFAAKTKAKAGLLVALVLGLGLNAGVARIGLAQENAPPPVTRTVPAPDATAGPAPVATTGDGGEAAGAAPAAVEPAPTTPRSASDNEAAAWSVALDQIEATLERESLTSDELTELRASASAIQTSVTQRLAALMPRYTAAAALLAQLQPADGATETGEAKAERDRQAAIVAELDRQIRPAQVIASRAEQALSEIADRRRTSFAAQMQTQTASALNPDVWLELATSIPSTLASSWLLLSDWWGLMMAKIGSIGTGLLLIALSGMIASAGPLRRKLAGYAVNWKKADPDRFDKAASALYLVAVHTAMPVIFFAVLIALLFGLEILPPRVENLVLELAAGMTVIGFYTGMSRGLLAPKRPTFRHIPVDDECAQKATRRVSIILVLVVALAFFSVLSEVVVAPHDAQSAVDYIILLIIAFGVRSIVKMISAGLASEGGSTTFWNWLIPVVAISTFMMTLAVVFGYLNLASFIAVQLLWSQAVLSLLYVLMAFCDEAITRAFQSKAVAGRWFRSTLGLGEKVGAQIGVILAGLTQVILVVVAGSLLVGPFGYESGDIFAPMTRFWSGFEVAGVSFSALSILTALSLLIGGIVVTRALKNWLEHRFLPSTQLDEGLKASLSTAVGYIGVIIAIMLGFTALGLNLENIAIVAGALSVGIGFGLQAVVSNFVSGLILLAERPFKVGDWIITSNAEGTVKRVSVRSTEIETFDRATVIVPNSDLITGVVRNQVHNTTLGRLSILVGVGYDSDPDQVKALLLECAEAHPLVLAQPSPSVYFMEFGASSLDFRLDVYIADIARGLSTRSDIRFAILREMRAAGIEIPFPKQDIYIREAPARET